MNRKLLNGLKVTGLCITTLGALFVLNNNYVNASTKAVHINHTEKLSLKKQAKGYVYANRSLSKVKSKNIKKNFGKHNRLSTKQFIIVNKHGKKNVYAYVNDIKAPKKSGWVAAKQLNLKIPSFNRYQKSQKHDIYNFAQEFLNNAKKHPVDNHGSQNDSSNNGHKKDAFDENVYSKNEALSIIKSKFIKFVNAQRQANGKSPLVESPGLMKVAQERAEYASVYGDTHYTDKYGNHTDNLAAIVDGQKMGVFNDSYPQIYESVGSSDFSGSSNLDEDDINNSLFSLESMINNDGASNNGHMNQLLGNYGSGLDNYGIGFRHDSNGITVVILQSDTNY